MKKRVILVDYEVPKDWLFHKALEEATGKKWNVITCVSYKMFGGAVQKLKRYLLYFLLPFQIFLHRRDYEQVLAWQQFYGLVLAFYFRLFHVKNAPKLTVMTFIYRQKKGIVGKLYDFFMKYIVRSGYINQFIVFSKEEPLHYADYFGISADYFAPEILGTDDLAADYEAWRGDNGVYVAPGRSNRDYPFLTSVWPQEKHLEIICDTAREESSSNISWLTDCHDSEYRKHLAACHAVLVPLLFEGVSSGQLVILEALMLGKPVIATRNRIVEDYLTDGVDALIIEKSREALLEAMAKLENQDYYSFISCNARKTFEEKYSVYAMGLRIGRYLQ